MYQSNISHTNQYLQQIKYTSFHTDVLAGGLKTQTKIPLTVQTPILPPEVAVLSKNVTFKGTKPEFSKKVVFSAFCICPLKAIALLIKYIYSLEGNLKSQCDLIFLLNFSKRIVMACIKIHLCLNIDLGLTVNFV